MPQSWTLNFRSAVQSCCMSDFDISGISTDGGLHEYLLKTKHKNSFFQNLLVPLVLFKQFNRKKTITTLTI